jgi:hypothetical protein
MKPIIRGRCRCEELRELSLERAEARRLGTQITSRYDARRLRRVVNATGAVDVRHVRIARWAAVGRCLEDGSTEAGDSPAHGEAPVNCTAVRGMSCDRAFLLNALYRKSDRDATRWSSGPRARVLRCIEECDDRSRVPPLTAVMAPREPRAGSSDDQYCAVDRRSYCEMSHVMGVSEGTAARRRMRRAFAPNSTSAGRSATRLPHAERRQISSRSSRAASASAGRGSLACSGRPNGGLRSMGT